MKLSTRGEYGLRAMLYLVMQQKSGDELLQASEIAEAQDIPSHYLKQILSRLRAAGLVRSSRGPQGGHGLGRDPAQISIGEIITVLEGPLTSVDAILDLPCHIRVGPQHCVIKEFLMEVKTEVESLLHGRSLADLASRQDVLVSQKILVQPRIMRPPGTRPAGRVFRELLPSGDEALLDEAAASGASPKDTRPTRVGPTPGE